MGAETTGLEQRLRALFAEELEENLIVLNRGLLALEAHRDGPPPPAVVAELFRAAHSLKGAAHSAGVPSVVAISDRMETCFAGLRDGEVEPTAATLTSLFADVDALAGEGRRMSGGGHAEDGDESEDVRRDAEEDGPVGSGAGIVRLAAHKLDTLLDRAAELRVSSQRLEALAAEAGAGRERIAARGRTWRTARATLAAAVASSDDPALAGAVDVAGRAWDEVGTVLDELTRSVATASRDLGQGTDAVAEATQQLRMQPFGQACEGFDRTVRDLANGAGKEVGFSIEGADLEIDRAVGAALREPVLHLLRNAVDHGIERPDERRRSGKPSVGSVRLTAAVAEGTVEVTVADDGAGVDLAALRRAAAQQDRSLPVDDVELVFAAGLSTAPAVSDVSGRGVGLDAVRARIERVGGTVRVDTEAGRGTAVVLRLPLTLSTFRALLVSAGDETLALPLATVRRLVRVTASDLQELEGRVFTMLDGKPVPVVSLGSVLGFDSGDQVDSLDGVVVASGGSESLLVVDDLLDEAEVLVKALPPRAAHVAGALGATVLADGRPALVVSPAACVRLESTGSTRIQVRAAKQLARPKRLVLAEDTLTTRVLEQSILEGAGYDVVVAVDGAQAWRLLQEQGADLVVSDVNMPEMDGFELCETIRASARFRDLPVVLVTSLASDEDRRRGLDVGASAYIVKAAFDQTALLTAIEQLL